MTDQIERARIRVKGFENAEMDFQLLRQLGATANGAASVGECLSAASHMTDGSPADWVRVFTSMGERLETDAKNRAEKGRAVSARDQYLRASNAYRAAEYFTYVLDPEHRKIGKKSRDCFRDGMKFSDSCCTEVTIPFEDGTLPAYFITPDDSGERRKTICIISGYDGTMEESYFLNGGFSAIERGYNLFLFAGPGQMDTLRENPQSTFKPDYENAFRPAIDWLMTRPETKPKQIALLGISMGGYLCLRAAACDPRITALIPDSPIVDWGEYLAGMGFTPAAGGGEDLSLDEIPNIPDDLFPPLLKEMMRGMIARHGQETFLSTCEYLRRFTARDLLGKIFCPCLALVGEGEGPGAKAQTDEFVAGVKGPVTTYIFTEEEGADAHCQVGNPRFMAAVVFDWLDGVFRR